MQSHKVIRNVKYKEYDESEKFYLFEHRDVINLIKIGEKVGIFEILKDRKYFILFNRLELE
jgi:hypothetical protein